MGNNTGSGPQYFGKDLEAMSFARNYHEWIARELQPYLGRSVAEVGAGVGSFSQLLLGSGIDSLTAYEPSQNMFPALQAALQGEPRASAIHGFFGEAGETEMFDSVVYVNVLEHVEDDAAELRRMRAAVRPKGHVLIFVPALSWLYSPLDRQVGHFRRYHRAPLVRLVADAGLSVVSARYFDFFGILPWYVNFVLLKNEIGGASVSLYDRLVVPVASVLERAVTPPVGKNLLLVAQRR
jgi:SAM-dependent methyltransferase